MNKEPAVTADTSAKTLFAERFRGFMPVIVDVETGGFNAHTDALLEIAAVTLKMDEQGFYRYTRLTRSMGPL